MGSINKEMRHSPALVARREAGKVPSVQQRFVARSPGTAVQPTALSLSLSFVSITAKPRYLDDHLNFELAVDASVDPCASVAHLIPVFHLLTSHHGYRRQTDQTSARGWQKSYTDRVGS